MPVILNDERIAYYPTPKVGCSSVKSALYQLAHGKPYEGTPGKPWVHDHYVSEEFRRIDEADRFYKFCIVRDPIDRLVSAYLNRVVAYKELGPEPPDFPTFVRYLEQYRMSDQNIRHHTDGQWFFIGMDLGYFDRVFSFDEISVIPAEIEAETGHRIELPHLQKGDGATLVPEGPEIWRLTEHYEMDYAILRGLYPTRVEWVM